MELPIRLSKESREPIYHQIENQIKALIAGGQLPAGTALPSIRAISKDLEVSVITTRRAYQDLERQGFIRTTQGKGTFVAEVDEGIKEQVKTSTVYEALEKAIETAIRHDYTITQIEDIFKQIITDKKKRGEK
ncbi:MULTISPECIES: GntR family transcriptional regulator [Alkalihalobacterium]|uniref:GntR family transcriptional regulator n=1 Tax=Alkalihalobacterium chitinilyticum TaxID=2980103 RepID=A0ABT5VD88_9BACI|nr:GntR family transcriptional regulator [Alkalihalobacterium chitinilyticum]MDE5413410.1 GntR family transcriptional regulator [Alkalihalobacterium chitinilyticum]